MTWGVLGTLLGWRTLLEGAEERHRVLLVVVRVPQQQRQAVPHRAAAKTRREDACTAQAISCPCGRPGRGCKASPAS